MIIFTGYFRLILFPRVIPKEGGLEPIATELMEMANAELVVSTTKKMDLLRRQLYVQSRSLMMWLPCARIADEMLKCIPPFKPVVNKETTTDGIGYAGVRIDPIYGYR